METIQTAAPPPVVTSGGGGGGDDESAPLPPPHLPPMKHRSASTSGGGGGGGGVKGGKGRGAGGLPSQSVEEKVCTACCVLFMSIVLCFVTALQTQVKALTGKANASRRSRLNKKIRRLSSTSISDSVFLESNGSASPTEGLAGRPAAFAPRAGRAGGGGGGGSQHGQGKGGGAGKKRKPRRRRSKADMTSNRGPATPGRAGNVGLGLDVAAVRAKCGKGSFAQCYTAKHNMTGQLACMKVIDLCPKKVDVPDVRAELGFLNQLQHPNCMRLIAFDIDITLTEFCPFSLEDLRVAKDSKESTRTRLDLKFARQCMYQVFQGVKYIHEFSHDESIGHFDIKPDNIMVNSKGVLMIADFGGKVTDGQFRGTEEFMSPEVDQEDDDGYGVKADIWSLGVMFNELVFGRCCKPARPSWSSMEKTGYAKTNDKAIRSFFALTFACDADKRADINALIKHPLFDWTQSGSQAAVLKEVAVVKRLIELRKAAERDFGKNGALPDVDLESILNVGNFCTPSCILPFNRGVATRLEEDVDLAWQKIWSTITKTVP
eukprot:gene2943-24880_t